MHMQNQKSIQSNRTLFPLRHHRHHHPLNHASTPNLQSKCENSQRGQPSYQSPIGKNAVVYDSQSSRPETKLDSVALVLDARLQNRDRN